MNNQLQTLEVIPSKDTAMNTYYPPSKDVVSVTNGNSKVVVICTDYVVKYSSRHEIAAELLGRKIANALGINTPEILNSGETWIVERRLDKRCASPKTFVERIHRLMIEHPSRTLGEYVVKLAYSRGLPYIPEDVSVKDMCAQVEMEDVAEELTKYAQWMTQELGRNFMKSSGREYCIDASYFAFAFCDIERVWDDGFDPYGEDFDRVIGTLGLEWNNPKVNRWEPD